MGNVYRELFKQFFDSTFWGNRNYSAADLHHQPLRSFRSAVFTACRHASFISLASVKRSSGFGEKAVASQSLTAVG